MTEAEYNDACEAEARELSQIIIDYLSKPLSQDRQLNFAPHELADAIQFARHQHQFIILKDNADA